MVWYAIWDLTRPRHCIVIPSIEPKYIHLFALSLDRTIVTKLGHKRKLEPEELVLPWQPLWQVLKKEVWPSKRETSSRYATP